MADKHCTCANRKEELDGDEYWCANCYGYIRWAGRKKWYDNEKHNDSVLIVMLVLLLLMIASLLLVR